MFFTDGNERMRIYKNGDVSMNENLTVHGDTSMNGSVTIGGASTMKSTLYVSKATTLKSTLNIGGKTTLVGDLSMNGNMKLDGNVDISGDLSLNGNLAVVNYDNQTIINTTVNDYQLVVTEDLSLNGELHVSGDASFNGKINGATIFSSNDPSSNLIMSNKTISSISGKENTAFGINALNRISTTGGSNTAFGMNALTNNTDGSFNTAIGVDALYTNQSGTDNVAVGRNSLNKVTNGNNVAIGGSSLSRIGDVILNTAIGHGSAWDVSNAKAKRNTFIGAFARFDVSTADYSNSTALGSYAEITASNQIMLGGNIPNNGYPKVFIPGELHVSDDASFNGKINGITLLSNDICHNLIIGNGSISGTDGSNNVGFGKGVFASTNINGAKTNVAMGNGVLGSITTAESNIAVGNWSQYHNQSGDNNVSVGTQALNDNIGASSNTAIGFQALYKYKKGGTTAIGYGAGGAITNSGGGWGNTFIGMNTGFNNITESYENSTALGYNAQITASKQIMLGTANETVVAPGKATFNGDVSFNSKLHIYESNGSEPNSNAKGSLVLEHGNAGGSSSITFVSAQSKNSDYGYIKYSDTTSTDGTERGILEIGVQDDGSSSYVNRDNIILKPSNNVGIGDMTDPQSKLSVKGNLFVGTTADVNNAPTDGLYVQGNVGIGSWPETVKLAVGGSAKITGDVSMKSTLYVSKATTLSSTLNVHGASSLNNILAVTGKTTLENDVSMNKAVTIGDASTMKSTLYVSKATTLKNTLNVHGASSLNNILAVTGKTTLENDVSMNKAVTIGDASTMKSTLYVSKATTLKNTLNVHGASSLNSTLDVNNGLLAVNNGMVKIGTGTDTGLESSDYTDSNYEYNPLLAVKSHIYTKGLVNYPERGSGPAAIDFINHDTIKFVTRGQSRFTIQPDGNINMDGGLFIDNDLSLNSCLYVKKATTMKSTLYVSKATTLKNTLNVVGASSLNNILAVTGKTTLENDVSMNKAVTIGGASTMKSTLYVSKATTLKNTLNVHGASSLNSTLYVNQAATLKSTLNIGGKTTLVNDLSMNGNMKLDGNVDISGDLSLNGNLTVVKYDNQTIINTNINDYSLIVTEDLSLNGELHISGDASLNGELYVKNNAIFDSSLNVNGETNFQYENTTQLPSSINISYDSSIDVSYNGVNFAPRNVAYSGDGTKLLYSNKYYTDTNGIGYNGHLFVTASRGYGHSIATNSDGKFTIVGNRYTANGTADLYYGGTWQSSVTGQNPNSLDGFEVSVSITSDGSYCAIGDPYYDSYFGTDNYNNSGRVDVYEIKYEPDEDRPWFLHNITTIEVDNEDYSNSDLFGQSVSIICDSTDIYVSSGAVNYEPNSQGNDSNYGLVRTRKISKSSPIISSNVGADITGSYNLRKEGRYVNLVFRDDDTLRLAISTELRSGVSAYITIYDIDKDAGTDTNWTKKNSIDISLPTITNIALNRGTSDVSGGDTLVVSNNDAGYIYDVRQASIDYFETKNISIQPVSMTHNNTSISITDDGSKVAVGNSTSNNLLVVNLNYSSPVDTQITASTDGFYIKKMVNTNDYQNRGQHNMQLRIENGMGIYDSKALEIGLLENGTGIIQANEKDVGYNTLLLNPLGGNVGIGSGKVGIGVTNPSTKLEIHNTSEQIRGRFYNTDIDNTGLFVLNDLNYDASYNGQPTPNAFFCSNNNYSTSNSNTYDESDISYNIAGSIGFGTATPYFGKYGQYAQIRGLRLGQWDGGLSFATMGPTDGQLSEKMRIIDNGSVGIGTTSPQSTLDVSGNIKLNNSIYGTNDDLRLWSNATNETSSGYLEMVPAYTKIAGKKIVFDTNSDTTDWGANRVTITESGRVGIGTPNPNYQLEVVGGDVFFRKDNDNSATGLWLGDSDTGLKQEGDGKLAFYTNGGERMRLANGSVGINKSDPSISYKLDVNGDVNATSYNASSDYRIKENVVPISDTSYNIDNLRPVTYTNTKMEKQDFGVIAHELQEQIPFLVTGEKDGEHHQSVNYNGLIGLLLNEVQQLKKRVQELEQSKP
jgi:cytoskeletal protein CcmA (bactofilin family)